jgi:apolipoprotein N-acyltransferase
MLASRRPAVQAFAALLARAGRGRACVLWVPPCALALLAAFPPLEWYGLGWVALAPLLLGLRAVGGRAAADGNVGRAAADRADVAAWVAAGWLWGLVFYGGQFAWLYHAFVELAGMGRLHFLNFYALVAALLALFPAAVLGGARAAWLRLRLSPLALLPLLLAGQDALLGVAPFGGVVWGSPAGPQAHTWAARVVVPVLGGAGLVLLLGLVNAGWAAWAARWARRGSSRGRWLGGAAWLALTLLCAWPAPVPAPPRDATRAAVLLVPGAASIAELVAQRNTPLPLRAYLGRTLPALQALPAESSRLVLWPESAVPGDIARGKALLELSEVAGLVGTDVLLGSNGEARGREFNSAYLVQGGPFDFWRYDKQRLVPFGEYVPAGFRWLFPRKLTAGDADYAAGTGAPVLDWRGHRLGVSICFESILPAHARAAVAGEAEALVVLANDAWLTPGARRQHVQLAALQGLAVGRDVLRVANGGWSGLLRGGTAVVLVPPGGAPLAVRPALRRERTPFARWGLVPLGVLAALLLAAAVAARRPRRGSA